MTRRIRLTTGQAARLAGVEPYLIRKWRERDLIVGGPRWVDGRSLLAHLDRRETAR